MWNVVPLECFLKVHDVPRHTQHELTKVPLAEVRGVEVGEVILLGGFRRQEGQRIRMEDLADYRRRLRATPATASRASADGVGTTVYSMLSMAR